MYVESSTRFTVVVAGSSTDEPGVSDAEAARSASTLTPVSSSADAPPWIVGVDLGVDSEPGRRAVRSTAPRRREARPEASWSSTWWMTLRSAAVVVVLDDSSLLHPASPPSSVVTASAPAAKVRRRNGRSCMRSSFWSRRSVGADDRESVGSQAMGNLVESGRPVGASTRCCSRSLRGSARLRRR